MDWRVPFNSPEGRERILSARYATLLVAAHYEERNWQLWSRLYVGIPLMILLIIVLCHA